MPNDRHTSQNFARRIHQRLLSNDPIASAELAQTFLRPLVAHLRSRYPRVPDESMLWDAATDAVLTYAENPHAYNPEKSGLLSYLQMAARGDLVNAIDKERRRVENEKRWIMKETVELQPGGGNKPQEDEEMRRIEGDVERDAARSEEIMASVYRALPEPKDRKMLELMMDGVRETRAFAEVLDIGDRDQMEQRRLVKQGKDRIKKRVQRLGLRLHG